MVHSSEFTGIGGFDLAAEWMGWENKFQCEIDPFCLELLNQNFPKTIKHEDIRKTDFTVYRGRVDVLSGGFPCQPYSAAGKRRGKADIRHLWPEMLRSAREFQPPYVVGENVRGLTNWNRGLVFNEVQADLEAEGYEVTPFLLPAAGINAPHERYRIFFIAYSGSNGHKRRQFIEGGRTQGAGESEGVQRERIWPDAGGDGSKEATANPNVRYEFNISGLQYKNIRAVADSGNSGLIANTYSNKRPERGMHAQGIEEAGGHFSSFNAREVWRAWENFPTESPLCRKHDGFSSRLDRIAANKHRTERLKGLGNAVVPQLAYQIFKAIQQFDDSLNKI